ncbi:hypothetical protein [Amycolatopsis sp. La24]|uniref:hypothetical protein n=1 Tax=Amycolatopsis sp. La24 TaxID=3028304 RepID=UPI0023AEDBE4|nr:hypothetical protein [Amycolatopsis sp. La24]
MSRDYDEGKLAIEQLIEGQASTADGRHRNEASTRLQIIDTLLIDVLRWPRSAVRAEEPAGSDRIDYAIGSPGIQLIVEAKREGIYFELPAGVVAGAHSISSITDGPQGKQLRAAMDQVSRYCTTKGVAPAAIANGHQLVAFIAIRTDGIPPLTGKALVFPDLQSMLDNYRLLWDSLSPAGIDDRNLQSLLRLTDSRPPEPLAFKASSYPGVKRRNDLQVGLQVLSELFLQDVVRQDAFKADFLKDCYASSGALSQYAEVSRQILQTRYAMLTDDIGAETAPVYSKKGLSPQLSKDILAAAMSRRPIVLLGDVGVGKTTFIQKLIHVDARDLFDHAITLYIDLGASTTLETLDSHVVDESSRQLLNNHGIDIEDADFVDLVYKSDIERFDRGVMGRLRSIDPAEYEKEKLKFLHGRVLNGSEHLKISLEYLRKKKQRQIVMFLDNIDQRSSEDQEQVFLISNEIANTWPCTVFVTLRPETFNQSSRKGALSGYLPRVFTISPPRADVMLRKRVAFALRQLDGSGNQGDILEHVSVSSENLVNFLSVLDQNFQNNRNVLGFIDNLAGGNMRLALRFVTSFIGSGHIDTRKILQVYIREGYYSIPLHEFMRAILYGEGVYYDPDSSPVANLFSITKPDPKEHFLKPLLVSHIQVAGDKIGKEGYVTVDDVYSFGQSLGFDVDQISSALEYAQIKRLIDTAPRESGDRIQKHYRITTVGAYTVRNLINYFAYSDAVIIDTSILDHEYRESIRDIHEISDRLMRAEEFRKYLDQQWSQLSGAELSWEWPSVSAQLQKDIARAGRKADPARWNDRSSQQSQS